MRVFLIIGLILLVLGVASLFIPFPIHEKHGVSAGGVNLGIETTRREKVDPIVSFALIGGGVVLLVVGSRGRKP
jgi:hypothetical protein